MSKRKGSTSQRAAIKMKTNTAKPQPMNMVPREVKQNILNWSNTFLAILSHREAKRCTKRRKGDAIVKRLVESYEIQSDTLYSDRMAPIRAAEQRDKRSWLDRLAASGLTE